MEIYTKLLKVSKKTGLPVKKILEMFFLLKSGPVENNQLVRRLGVSRNVLNQVKRELVEFLKPTSAVTGLKPKVKEKIQPLFDKDFVMESKLWSFLKGKSLKQTVNCLEKYQQLRPRPKKEYDQFTATLKTTAKRAVLMNFFGDIHAKKILFLGDDDLTSVAVANFKTAAKIVVLDIDKRILEAVEKVAKSERLQIETAHYDAREELSANWRSKFDIVFTDPPYTPGGIRLFLSRAIQALDLNNRSGRIYLCYGNSDRSKERFLPIYEILIKSGLMMRWVFDKFNRYHGAESIGSTSSLFVCDVTPKTKVLIHGKYQEKLLPRINLVK